MVADLRAESDDLDGMVADLPADRWGRSHPCARVDGRPSGRAPAVDRSRRADRGDRPGGIFGGAGRGRQDPTGFVDAGAEELAVRPPDRLLTDWRHTRLRLHDELLAVANGRKLPWFGPPMSAASMATARLMETWAHGLDVADTLGVKRPATARLRSIAHIGVRTRDFAFSINGLAVPAEPFRVELRAPDGATWSWGPEDAGQRVTGTVEDFCMLVTQRRPRAALDVHAVGDDAEKWLSIAQAFAGPPGPGRQ
jgi:uncharacterized protein (TIGR03084 family)